MTTIQTMLAELKAPFTTTEPIILAWLVTMLVLAISLPIIFIRHIWRQRRKRPRAKREINLLD